MDNSQLLKWDSNRRNGERIPTARETRNRELPPDQSLDSLLDPGSNSNAIQSQGRISVDDEQEELWTSLDEELVDQLASDRG